MGRKVSALQDDGRPLTGFVLSLRDLWAEAGAPETMKELAARVGYSQPRLSELFNARKVPSDDLLGDVVQALKGDSAVWLVRLKALRVAEERFQAAASRQGDSLEARIARLEEEKKRLLTLTTHPESVIAQAKAADEAAAARALGASNLEAQARALLTEAIDQFRQLHERMPIVQRQADSVIADARAVADRCLLDGRTQQERIVQEANDRAESIIRKSLQEASALKQRTIRETKAQREKAAASVDRLLRGADQLRGEAEQFLQQAETRRSNMETRAKIEIERIIEEAIKRLEAAGANKEVEMLELLLLDFNINDSHTQVRGRHARRPAPDIPPPSQDPRAGTPQPQEAPVEPAPVRHWSPRWGFPPQRS
ncbi:helix-turn-helix transcriptional regulator [Streptomyces sp. NPDC002688]|uniref:helix-turn-helix transcriptional regulator n=1 Tax=Streptomyces sp. NPDC002688 TaxID=3154423 RepID=UPI00331BCB9A